MYEVTTDYLIVLVPVCRGEENREPGSLSLHKNQSSRSTLRFTVSGHPV